jgi:hypothetical protein
MFHLSLHGSSSALLIGVLASLINAQSASGGVPGGGQSSETGAKATPVKSPCRDKAARTPAQRKISSQLLCAMYPPQPPASAKPRLRSDSEGRVLVDIRAKLTDKLVACVGKMGGKVVSQSERYNSILAYVALDKLEKIAGLRQVKSIRPAAEAATN